MVVATNSTYTKVVHTNSPGTLLSSASTQFVVVGWPQTVHMYSQFVVAG